MMQVDAEQIRQALRSRDAALAALKELAGQSVDAPEGPVQVGSVKGILAAKAVEEVARHYLDAFENDKMTFPYFMDKQK